jgi:hypothetical protein
MNEGLSEVSAYVNGFGASFAAGSYLFNTDIPLTSWPESESTSPFYGGGYLFNTYFLERFGEEGVALLVADPLNGMEGVQSALDALGEDISAADLFADFAVANILNDPSVSPIYAYQAVSESYGAEALIGTASVTLSYRSQNLPVRSGTQGINPYGVQYIAIEGPANVSVNFEGAISASILPTQTTDTDGDAATADHRVWWSNRGDESNMTLTHPFDLSDVDSALLEYDLWFLIEDRWDYGYVEVSTDGGLTWTILETPLTTTDNPYGNSFGPGYTGSSASFPGADADGWISESLDLSAYAGQEILLRFEMVTDDAVNQPGLAIDNIRIEAIRFYDDAEAGDGDWEAEGFVRHDNVVPQDFIVQAIIPGGGGTRVERMALDANNHGSLSFAIPRSEEAILVIIGVARHTSVPGVFSYTIEEVE